MNKLYGISSVPQLSRSGNEDILSLIEDVFQALASDLASIMTSWNEEVYTTLGTLPQGVSDTRWALDNTINPKVNNLDGANIFVDTNASSVSDSGLYWSSSSSRPLTIKESFNSFNTLLSTTINSIRTEINSIGSSGLTADQIARIGDNIFDSTKASLSTSLDGLTQSNNKHAVQLAKDLYDVSSWSWTSDGSPALTNYSVKDMLNALLVLHNGAWDSDIVVDHSGLSGGGGGSGTTYDIITGALNNETTSTSEVRIGGFTFDPGEYGASEGVSLSDIEVYFEGELNYIAAGAGSLLLYDIGVPGSTGPGTLRSTISRSHTGSNLPDRVRQQLTLTGTPGTDADQISDTVKVYEIRMVTDGLGAGTDTIQVIWGGLIIQPA